MKSLNFARSSFVKVLNDVKGQFNTLSFLIAGRLTLCMEL